MSYFWRYAPPATVTNEKHKNKKQDFQLTGKRREVKPYFIDHVLLFDQSGSQVHIVHKGVLIIKLY